MEQRAVIKFNAKLGRSASETYISMKQVYGTLWLSKSNVFIWHKRFSDGRNTLEDDKHTGRPSSSKTPESIEKVREFVANNRSASLGMMAEVLHINKETIRTILHGDLGMPSHRRSNLSQRSNSSRVQHAYRLRETRGQNIRRLREQSARQAAVRSLETPDPIHSRLQAHSEIYSSTRRNTSTNNFFSSVWSSMENAGFNYSVAVEYFKHPLISLGMMDTTCRFCGALRWKDESSGMCCSNGKVRLPLIDLPPEPLRSLLSGENSDSVHFLRNIRKYNSCFQMTSFGAENQTHSVTFPTTFSIQGQVYHRIGSLMPSENQRSRFLQIYFMGNDDDDDDIQTDRRCQQIQGVRRNIVQGLQRMLHQHNLLVQQFKTALENLPSDAYRIVVNADRTPPGQHPRRYNAPTANEVAVVLAGNQFGSRDIVLHQRDNLLQHVSDTHRFYDALQYPLIFWKGQEGYSFHIPQID
ncbi:hypothetical protein LAZ67_14001209 [Cordylochernes scorpioides]|uniref:Helitron helicase-like domain-containing protein n=1 Tax=Cordylochernes scorpioides TaxID=51811 RepID=A0ABY6L606_9ARAC|nr:hypothetical protein LAZ67_14001209 [Cordylochernes scorpioides]